MSLQPSFEAQAREISDFTDNTYKRMMNVTYKEIVQSISIPMLPDVECCSLFRTPEQSSGVSCFTEPMLTFWTGHFNLFIVGFLHRDPSVSNLLIDLSSGVCTDEQISNNYCWRYVCVYPRCEFVDTYS